MAKVVVLLAEGFEEIEAVTPVDVLRRAGCEVTLAGLTGNDIVGSHGVTYRTDVMVKDLDGEFDMMVLPGGMPGSKNLGESDAARKLACDMAAQDKFITAICAAPALTLGPWGLLDGRNATCYPGMEKMFPAAVKASEERVVIDGKVITSRGPGTALEFSLALAGALMGKDRADELAKDMVVMG